PLVLLGGLRGRGGLARDPRVARGSVRTLAAERDPPRRVLRTRALPGHHPAGPGRPRRGPVAVPDPRLARLRDPGEVADRGGGRPAPPQVWNRPDRRPYRTTLRENHDANPRHGRSRLRRVDPRPPAPRPRAPRPRPRLAPLRRPRPAPLLPGPLLRADQGRH